MARKNFPFRCDETQWEDMAGGNAAYYGYPQDLVDAFAEKMDECAAYWAKKRAKSRVANASSIKPAIAKQKV